MDSIHDMGGMHGFGRIIEEMDEPVFHAAWEGRVYAMASAVPFGALFGPGQFRPGIERIPPGRYLSASYYEKWLDMLTGLMIEHGCVTRAELADPNSVPVAPPHPKAMTPEQVLPGIFGGFPQSRPSDGLSRRFKAGDRVMTKRHMSASHTRLPRYARDQPGRVLEVRGAFLVYDRVSTGDPTPDILYTVVFAASDIWGPQADPRDSLTLDLWDCYLEAA